VQITFNLILVGWKAKG